jgi:phosphoenolpyruvate carboxykinase (GTP)
MCACSLALGQALPRHIRVLAWIVARLEHEVGAVETPIGRIPFRHDLDLEGLGLRDEDVRSLLTVDPAGSRRECDAIEGLFARFGDRLPAVLTRRLRQLRWRLGSSA